MGSKVIAVTGATGAQGGSLIRSILADKSGEFLPRAITRKPQGERAQALAKAGVEVVAADFDDAASVARAFKGAYGAFCVTNFWEHFSADKELAQAKALAEAAKTAGVTHAVWSTLEDTRKYIPLSDARMPTLQGRYKVPHFDAKGEANGHFTALGVPTTMLNTCYYWENFVYLGLGPKKGADGKLAFVLPMADKKLPSISVEDIGRCAFGVFKRGSEFIGKSIGVVGEMMTGAQMAEAFSRAFEQPVAYSYVPPEVYRTFGFPGADDMANMYQFKRDFETEYCGARDLKLSRALNPELQTFAKWLSQNKSKISLT